MPFQVSPGVNVSEIDLTTVIPAVSTTEGALVGEFQWGPMDERILVDSEDSLIARFLSFGSQLQTSSHMVINFTLFVLLIQVSRL